MKWISAYYSICIFLCAIFSGRGEALAQEQAFQAGDSLYSAGRFFEAAIAYEREFFLSQEAVVRAEASLRKSRALKQQGEYFRAVMDLQRSLPYAPGDSLRREMLYEMAVCSYLSGVYSQAYSLLQQYEVQYPNANHSEAFSLLKGMVLVKMRNWDQLNDYLLGISRSQHPSDGRDSLLKAMQTLLLKEHRPVERDPEKARLLSTFLPGTGHFFAGNPGAGILNGFSQLASLGVAVLLGYNQMYISGVIVGLGMFQSFYFGGIRQAGELTEERNILTMQAYQETLLAMLLELYQSAPNEP
ncbi:MAG: hypothetical protein V2I46_10805 [Bacteroides sp.]|jgi:tetratricopeptide (TPR) repeat protein|nr:hypothetical protein [Bacteroides sp.]